VTALPEQIGSIGGGQMAEAILRGLIAAGHPAQGVTVAEPRSERRSYLAAELGVRTCASNAEAAAQVDLALLAVKPAQLEAATAGLSLRPLYVSILAGRSLADLQRCLGPEARIVRAMPNTPALIGGAISGICAAPGRERELDLAEALLGTVGDVVRLAEPLLDAVTAVSGSGPAYAYLFIEALTEAGVAEGLDAATARRLAAQTLKGSARMVLETGEHPAVLRERVCSPGGTTSAGLRALDSAGFRHALHAAVAAAAARSRALKS